MHEGKMENGHGKRSRSDDEEEIEDEASPSEPDEQPLKSSSLVSLSMPCTSTTDAQGRRPVYIDPSVYVVDSSDDGGDEDDRDENGRDDDGGDADDDDTSEEEERDLTVTFRPDNTDEEIATATLILKRYDPVENFLPFAGALLRSIHSEEMKLKLMEDISQILINAKTVEIQRYRRPRLQ